VIVLRPEGFVADPTDPAFDEDAAFIYAHSLYESEDPPSTAEISSRTGLSRSRILNRARRNGWKRADDPEVDTPAPGTEGSMVLSRTQTAQVAQAGAQAKWAEMKGNEAEAAAETMELARETLNDALINHNVGLIKATSDAYVKMLNAAMDVSRALGLDKAVKADASGLNADTRRALLSEMVDKLITEPIDGAEPGGPQSGVIDLGEADRSGPEDDRGELGQTGPGADRDPVGPAGSGAGVPGGVGEHGAPEPAPAGAPEV
jgi:hypothetical protein